MISPLSLWDLSLWISVTAIILLVTSELLSPRYGRTSIIINEKRLRTAALSLGILFILTVFMRVYEILFSP